MDLGLAGRIVAVTGAGLGIGRAAALEIAREGGSVVIGARNAESLAETAEAARSAGASAAAVVGDLATDEGVHRLVDAAVETYGRLDGLVCCVGSTPLGDFGAVSDEQWRQAFEMKLLATIKAIRAARSPLAASGQGRVVVVTGNASRTRYPYLLTSAVMNSALENLVAALAPQLGTDGIAINAVSPGPVRTRRYEGLVEAVAAHTGADLDTARAGIDLTMPSGRVTEPEEVAHLIAYLVSPAAAQITGATYLVDGGQRR